MKRLILIPMMILMCVGSAVADEMMERFSAAADLLSDDAVESNSIIRYSSLPVAGAACGGYEEALNTRFGPITASKADILWGMGKKKDRTYKNFCMSFVELGKKLQKNDVRRIYLLIAKQVLKSGGGREEPSSLAHSLGLFRTLYKLNPLNAVMLIDFDHEIDSSGNGDRKQEYKDFMGGLFEGDLKRALKGIKTVSDEEIKRVSATALEFKKLSQ